MINHDEYDGFGEHWDALYVKNIEVICFGSLNVEYVPKEIKKFIGQKNIKTNISRIQANNSIMCGYFCIGFTDWTFADKTLIYYTRLFSSYDFEKSDDKILSYFKNE